MPNTYTLLETITVGAAGASSVTFNSIPQTGYTDLVIKASPRSTIAEDTFGIRFNSDSGSNYPYRGFVGQGASVSSFSGTNTFIALGRMPESGYTANTFGSNEFYIPNYTSSNQKSVSIDAVNENNATTARAQLAAGLWTGTAAITTIQVLASAGSFTQYSSFQLYGVSALGVTPTKAPKATGGSIIQTDGTYWYHAFLSSGTFTPATALSCDVLVVAGGGGGHHAGGGAGGYRSTTGLSLTTSATTVTIGAGGAGADWVSGTVTNGNNSVFSTITSTAGGSGGNVSAVANNNGAAGGSGGGGGGVNAGNSSTGGAGNAGSFSPVEGYAGGNYTGGTNNTVAAGGGGAGGVGGNVAASTTAGAGGAGSNAHSSWLSVTGLGVSGYLAGGGGGGNNGTAGIAGSGGGGAGDGSAAVANTGSGGGGKFGVGGNGGSGLVIIRYLAA